VASLRSVLRAHRSVERIAHEQTPVRSQVSLPRGVLLDARVRRREFRY